MRAEEHGVHAQGLHDLVRNRPDQGVGTGDDATGDNHLNILGFERLDKFGDGNRVGEDGDAAGLLGFKQVLCEHVGGGAAADGDDVARGDVVDCLLCDGVLEADVHLRFYGEQRFAQQGAGGHCAAVDAFEQALVGEFGDVPAYGHG